MRLKPGKRLGRLEIVDFVDAGGMGEVYRALDPDLDREVAVKVLPTELAEDRSRIERMEREARAVGRLRHPNILAIHDIGRHEGAPYLVYEFLDGRTLRDRLSSGRLPLAEALSIASQIAAGLAAAHAEGIVHRDLKPENLMVLSGGEVKILDFGLAKLTGRPVDDPTVQPTLTVVTEPQAVMGTAAYMSPEQVAGRPADLRADQFALGVILREALCGRHPFERETAAEVMTAILKEEAAPCDEALAPIPPPVRWLIDRCLEKDPTQRYASTSDLARDLATLRDRHRELTGVVEPRARPKRFALPLGLAALALAAVALAAALWVARDETEAASQLEYQRITFRRGTVTAARFDPEGESVLYTAAWEGGPSDVYLATPGTPDPIRVGPPGSVLLAVSSQRNLLLSMDRQADGPFVRTGTLSRKPVTGAPRAIDESIVDAAWGPGGEISALVRDVDRQAVLEAPPGNRLHASWGMIWSLRTSPDGRRFAFVETSHRGANFGPIVVIDSEGEVQLLSTSGDLQGLAWSADGREIWFGRGNSVMAVDLAGSERVVATFPQRVVLHDVAADGRVLLAVEPTRWEIAGRAPGATSEMDLSWLSYSLPFAILPDGETLLFNECFTADCTVGLRGFDTEPPVLLGEGFAFAVAPDGRHVFSALPWRGAELVIIPTGPGERRTLDLGDQGIERVNMGIWSTDGKALFLNGDTPEGPPWTFLLDLETGRARRITSESVRWGYVAAAPNGEDLAVQLASGQTAVVRISSGESVPVPGLYEQPAQWSSDGRYLYTFQFGQMPLDVKRVDVATGAFERFALLEPTDTTGVVDIGPVAISADGDAYAYGYRRLLSALLVVKGME